MTLMGTAGATAAVASLNPAKAATCLATPAETEGPYFVEENLNRSDIRTDPTTGVARPGILLALQFSVGLSKTSGCAALPGARVEIWHCDAGGLYSDEAQNNTAGQKFLRGYQFTDENGVATFTTIYPGWYTGRAVHIHFKVRTYSGSTKLDEFTSQIYFDDSLSDTVYAQAPYNTRGSRDTRNTTDNIYSGTQNPERLLAKVAPTDAGYTATIDVAVNLQTPTVSKAVLTTSGIVNAASYETGVTPGAWISIFGQSLATTVRSVTTADLINGNLPTMLAGVSVKINNQDAFLQYVSPTQINVQAPADTSLGNVQVTVTNAGGTSDPVTASLLSVFPAFFTASGYVAAVSADGTVITSAKAGDLVSLFGTGFGPTDPVVSPGAVGSVAAPLTNPVSITIGGMEAATSFAGLSAAGLDQFNLTVPNLAAGDHEVIAGIAGSHTKSGVLLKIAS